MDRTPASDVEIGRRNLRLAAICASVFFGMVGLAFASAPLYALFCQITGFGGTTQVATSTDGIEVLDRTVTVRFDANVSPKLPWSFEPVQREVTLRLGEIGTIEYRARNTAAVPSTGTATFNVTPIATGPFFSKIACFCFTEQTLQPGQELVMPVQFFVDPAMIDDPDTAGVHTITLSYTFFPVAGSAPVATVDLPAESETPNRL